MKPSKEMIDRFLTWPVPADVYPDGTPGKPGRTGTNLLTAQQAESMLGHVLGCVPQGMTREFCATWPSSAAGIINEFARRIDARDEEIARLRTALRFYARGEHYADPNDELDTVSGEPESWLCGDGENCTVTLEDGRVALFALQGIDANWRDGDEDHTPQPVDGEVSCVSQAREKG